MLIKNKTILKLLKCLLSLFIIVMLFHNVALCKTSTEWPCSDPTDHLTYPENAPQINVFHVAVIGDSIAWGEGLNQNEKYYYLVAKWLNEELKRPIDVTVYAHNAAKLKSSDDSKCTYPECSNSDPSIMKQSDLIKNPSQVDLILVSGGINDVDVLGNVGNIDIDSAEIRKITRQEIQGQMTELLNKLLARSQNAKIIVTGYYRIITQNSHDLDISSIYPILYKETHNGKELPKSLGINNYKPLLIKNSEAFLDESNKCLRDSVNATNSDRVIFATVDFPTSSSVAADNTWLWNFDLLQAPKLLFKMNVPTNDHKYKEREAKCSDSIIDLSSAFAHPNIRGAQQYRDAIVHALKPFNDYAIFPSNAKKSEAYHIAVIGDSIAWGNGLKKENKYYYQVAEWLYKKIGKPVDVTVYAHSGAIITGGNGESKNPNLNSASPALLDQAYNIPNNADLILVSGGINDVGINNILDANTPTTTISTLSESIRVPMENLLKYLLHETNAKIIVTGYYPLITEESKVEIQDRAVAGALATQSEKTTSQTWNVLFAAIADPIAAKLEAAWYLVEGIANNWDNLFEEDGLLRANSDTFYAISSNSLKDAVNNTDKSKSRVMFVDPVFQRRNSYRASDSFLWVLNKDLKTNDDQYKERVELTRKTYSLDLNPFDLDLIKQAENNINPIAHPNVKGANRYARSIESALDRYQSVNISVFNSAGIPAVRASVILDTNFTYIANTQGKLVLLLPDGNHTINASKTGYGTGNWTGFINSTQNTSINITLKLPDKHLFTITTLNSAHFPLADTEIRIEGMQKGRTGPDGNLSIELFCGNYTIQANNSGYGSGNWTGILDNRTNSVARIVLNGPLEYPFNITTFNSAGYPMEGTGVTIDGKYWGSTDKNGLITAMLIDGNHTIDAVKPDYGSKNWTGILNYNQSHVVPITLNGPFEYPFNITVINAANYSIDGATVSLAGVKKGITDSTGWLRTFLPEGNQTIRAVKEYYGSANWTGELNHADGKTIEIKIDGPLEYPFGVVVTNSAGNMIPDANVLVDGRLIGITDINGYLRAMLTNGNHSIEANKSGYDPGKWAVLLNFSLDARIPIVLNGSALIQDMKPIDLCFVLDTSGSMADPACGDLSKIKAVKDAAQDTIASFFYPGTSNRVAIAYFCHYPATVQEFTNNYRQAYDNVSYLYADGATSFGAGLFQAIEEFKKINQSGHVRRIIFMSDGMHNTAPGYEYYLALCRIMNISVYTIGYGSEADHGLLKEMAARSGGEYLFADPCGEMERGIRYMFMRQLMNLSGSIPLINASGVVMENETVNATYFEVKAGSKYPTIVLLYPGSHLMVKLIGPDGKLADPKEYVYAEDKRVVTVRLKDPKPGKWTVQVYGDKVNGTEPYTIYVSPKYVAPTAPAVSFKSIVIKEKSGETLKEYPVKISFNPSNFPAGSKADGSDISIFDQNAKDLPRWIEKWDAKEKKGDVWVKIPEIPAKGELCLMMLTGNPGEPSPNNGSDVFDFFDDFNDGIIDSNLWSVYNNSSSRVDETNGTLHIWGDARSFSSAGISSHELFEPNITIRFLANASSGQNMDRKGMGFLEDNVRENESQISEGVYWRAQDKNIWAHHKFVPEQPSKLPSGYDRVEPKYLSGYRTWEIQWLDSLITYNLDDKISVPHKDTGKPNEAIGIEFCINTSVQTMPSDIFLDWVFAYNCASSNPEVVVQSD